MSFALGMLFEAMCASPGGALRPVAIVPLLPVDEFELSDGTVYVDTVTRLREYVDDGGRGSGVSGASSSTNASANGSSMVGICTTGAVDAGSADTVRSTGAGGGGGARRVGVGLEKDRDVRRGRLPEAGEWPMMLGAADIGAVRLGGAAAAGPGPARKGRERGAQTLGMRVKEEAWAGLIARGMEGAKQEGAPNAPWMVWMRCEETAMADGWLMGLSGVCGGSGGRAGVAGERSEESESESEQRRRGEEGWGGKAGRGSAGAI